MSSHENSTRPPGGDSGDLVLLFGNSHANCMFNALRQKLVPVVEDGVGIRVISSGSDAFPGGLTLVDGLGRKVPNPVITRGTTLALAERGRRVWLASLVGGNHANRLGLFAGADHARFLDPDETPAATPAAGPRPGVFVPYDLIEYQLTRSMASVAELYRLLPLSKVAGVVHLEGPPPAPDAEFIVANLPERTRQLTQARGLAGILPSDVAPIEFRHKIWKAQSRVAKRIAEAGGAHYLSPPSDIFGANGYRLNALCADATHGTAEYGAMYLSALRSFVLQQRDLKRA